MTRKSTNHKPGRWSQPLPLETETCFFILVNALDVVVTYILLNHGPEFRESNQLANYVLTRFGFRSMIYFKFATVAMVTVVVQIIARTHLRTARWLLISGTVFVGGVVVYSLTLWLKYSGYFGW
jgi:hypothetical protein